MKEYIKRLFSLNKGIDNPDAVLKYVEENSYFMGASAWTLVFAIIIASVGLNLNSIPVIIGAMLISPLMGPIVAAGFGIAIYDLDLLKKSGRNLLIATLISLIASGIYFWLSPFKELQSELLSRTSPTIYDVIIAFFGGLTGAVAITRKDKGNPIPGVAIATALMPPLCTAGYGLALQNAQIFFGAMYLYIINCTFIFVATIIIVKFLNFKSKVFIAPQRKKIIKYSLGIITIIVLLPSIYFAIMLYEKQKFIISSKQFIESEFIENGFTLVYQKVHYNPSSSNIIELAFLSDDFTEKQVDSLSKTLSRYNIFNTKLEIKSNNSKDLMNMRNDLMNEVSKSQRLISYNTNRLDSIFNYRSLKNYETDKLLSNLQIIAPEITEIGFQDMNIYYNDTSSYLKPILIYNSKNKINNNKINQIRKLIANNYGKDSILIIWQK